MLGASNLSVFMVSTPFVRSIRETDGIGFRFETQFFFQGLDQSFIPNNAVESNTVPSPNDKGR
ncbi:MAG: hypothetical protein HZB11_03140 [Candidatus Yonathbacteria bacterium]|nr:hypothetical protein [Candidatus Yonathbacteria bacterium]